MRLWKLPLDLSPKPEGLLAIRAIEPAAHFSNIFQKLSDLIFPALPKPSQKLLDINIIMTNNARALVTSSQKIKTERFSPADCQEEVTA